MNSYADTELDSVEVLNLSQYNNKPNIGSSGAAANAYGNSNTAKSVRKQEPGAALRAAS